MIQIRFKDIDPDSGDISQDQLIATCENQNSADWVTAALARENADFGNPNREFYTVDLSDLDRELTYEERIAWFVANYYETGMEYSSLLESMKDSNLDQFEWIGGEIVAIPKTVRDLKLD